jgi:hypothetical protein
MIYISSDAPWHIATDSDEILNVLFNLGCSLLWYFYNKHSHTKYEFQMLSYTRCCTQNVPVCKLVPSLRWNNSKVDSILENIMLQKKIDETNTRHRLFVLKMNLQIKKVALNGRFNLIFNPHWIHVAP